MTACIIGSAVLALALGLGGGYALGWNEGYAVGLQGVRLRGSK